MTVVSHLDVEDVIATTHVVRGVVAYMKVERLRTCLVAAVIESIHPKFSVEATHTLFRCAFQLKGKNIKFGVAKVAIVEYKMWNYKSNNCSTD